MPSTPRDWITRAAVARELGIDWNTVAAVAEAGGVRVRQLPGLAPRYHADDVARIKAEAEAPASMAKGVA